MPRRRASKWSAGWPRHPTAAPPNVVPRRAEDVEASRRLHPVSRAVLLAFGLVVFGLLFEQLATLLVAILITVLIAIPLSAVATRLERFRVPRAVGALIGLVIGLGVLAGILALVFTAFVDEVRTLADQAPSTFDSLK